MTEADYFLGLLFNENRPPKPCCIKCKIKWLVALGRKYPKQKIELII